MLAHPYAAAFLFFNWIIATFSIAFKSFCKKSKGMTGVMPLLFGAGDEARTRYLHLGKVALYQMSYARGTKRTIPDIFPFVKMEFQNFTKIRRRRLANAGKL